MPERFSVAIIGSGISGLSQAISLQNTLGDAVDILIFEKSHAPGGVWRDAQWAGAEVDVPIHLYSLWSDTVGSWPSHYASQPEVLAYWNTLIDKHRLRSRIILDTEYISSSWDEAKQQHTLVLKHKDGTTYKHEANVIISANGPLSKPEIPEIDGLEHFQGQYFHNLRWDPSVRFEGKRVAVVGNGSSGIQIVPGIATVPGVTLTHYIRSGGYFFPKVNYQYNRFLRFVFEYVPLVRRIHRFLLFIESNDRWRAKPGSKTRPTKDEIELLKYLEVTAPAEYLGDLKPDYPLGCKRLAFDAGWLKSLHRPNVHLVKSEIQRATATGLVTADGIERPFDLIVFATGSNVAEYGVGLNAGLKGEKGLELRQHWQDIGGPKAYRGTAVPGFPNYFAIIGPNAIAGSWGYTVGVKTSFNTLLIQEMLSLGISSIQPTREAFEHHNQEVQQGLLSSNMRSLECSNWWRIGGQGHLSVPSHLSGYQMARQCRGINWSDWKALERGEDGTVREVNVAEVRRRQSVLFPSHALWAAFLIPPAVWLSLHNRDSLAKVLETLLSLRS